MTDVYDKLDDDNWKYYKWYEQDETRQEARMEIQRFRDLAIEGGKLLRHNIEMNGNCGDEATEQFFDKIQFSQRNLKDD